MLPSSITYKQLEAVYWIIELKGFQAAARKLHTTQSAISKRVRDLERSLGADLFDRSGHAARPTRQGEEFWAVAKQLLAQRDAAFGRYGSDQSQPERIRFGVSEYSAMTWLPSFVQRIHARYPAATQQPDVDLAASMLGRLIAGELDLAFIAESSIDQYFTKTPIGTVESAWVCVPAFAGVDEMLTPAQLGEHTLLQQRVETSVTARLCANWADTYKVNMHSTIRCNSLSALLGMTLSGIGIGYLPRGYVRSFLDSGQLREVRVSVPPPAVVMCAAHLPHPEDHYVHELVHIALNCCGFDQTLWSKVDHLLR